MTNQVMLLGAGMERIDAGVQLSELGVNRASRFLDYYYAKENRDAFTSPEAFVLCTGGYGLITSRISETNANEREGLLTADFLMDKGNVPSKLIRVESESTSTLTNFTNSIREGLIKPEDYDEKNRLGLVSHPNHLRRVAYVAGKLSIDRTGLELIPTHESDSRATELVMSMVTRVMLVGAHEMTDLESREEKLEQLISRFRPTHEI